jgi:hypothetical protein
VLLATDYFTKWVEAIPLKKVTSKNMVEFVKEHIITDLEFLKQLQLVKELSLHLQSSENLLKAWGSNC